MPELSGLRAALVIACCIVATGDSKAQLPDPKVPQGERERPKFSLR